jgi:hypothetical protein
MKYEVDTLGFKGYGLISWIISSAFSSEVKLTPDLL